jgi:uncharacterized protein YndB with AHSA1/START domain
VIWSLELVLPRYDHREFHSKWIDAPVEKVWDALGTARIRELPLTANLVRLRGGLGSWMRGGGEEMDMRAMDAFAPRPLATYEPHELVLGDIARYSMVNPARPDVPRGDIDAFRAFDEPGWSKTAMNFRLTEYNGGTTLSTETRVLSTDASTQTAFRLYWLLIRAGSGVIRQDILRAVNARATR